MKRLIFTAIMLLSMAASVLAGTGTWTSKATGTALKYTTSEATGTAAKDYNGKYMTVVYLENLACEKIGQNTNAEDVAWLRSQGYRVIELDYANNAKAVSPNLNLDIIEINSKLNGGSFCGCSNISSDRAYILFEGYRIQRDISYYKDDPTVYNYPSAYATMEGDSLYMDLIYPANPSKAVPTVLEFSYSNSYAGTANEGYTGKKYAHKRMYLGYTFSMFKDSFLEGCPAVGCAWAIADHPKYCDWGRGNRANGSQKEFGSIEITPDAARKVKSAIRTIRGIGKTLGLGNDVGICGFSRGSTVGSLAIGDNPFSDWTELARGRFADEASDVQVAFLGPGIFDYSKMTTTSNEYVHMTTYANSTSDAKDAWAEQGGALAVASSKTAPTFLFYNSDDDANYITSAKNIMGIFDKVGVTYEVMTDYGSGHAVPQKTADLQKMYDFLLAHTSSITGITAPAVQNVVKGIYTINGLRLDADFSALPHGIYIVNGKKVVK